MKILFIERPISEDNTYGVETGEVEGDNPHAEGYEVTFKGRIYPRSSKDTARLNAMRDAADVIYEVDNICAKNKPFRLK
jgi:hypothetical protein